MQNTPIATRLYRIGKGRAIALLLVLAVLAVALVYVALTQPPAVERSPGETGDLVLYQSIIARMRAGTSYYPAAHAELLSQGYGTLSVFNWRLPAVPWLVSLAPWLAVAQAVLLGLAVAAIGVTATLMSKAGGRPLAIATIVLLALSLALAGAPSALFFTEVPAGLLILLSAGCYGLKRHGLGLASGAAALFVRELAGLYVLVCIALAWRARRYRELLGWTLVLLAYAGYFAWHYHNVQLQLGPADRAYPDGWLQWGGLGFILTTAAFNGVFAALPLWANAVILPMALLGLLAWPRTGAHLQLAVALYLLAFAMIGKPFNVYWGLLYTPMLTMGLAWFPAAMLDVWSALRSGPKPAASPV